MFFVVSKVVNSQLVGSEYGKVDAIRFFRRGEARLAQRRKTNDEINALRVLRT